MNTFIP